jgi:hypothetical protein
LPSTRRRWFLTWSTRQRNHFPGTAAMEAVLRKISASRRQAGGRERLAGATHRRQADDSPVSACTCVGPMVVAGSRAMPVGGRWGDARLVASARQRFGAACPPINECGSPVARCLVAGCKLSGRQMQESGSPMQAVRSPAARCTSAVGAACSEVCECKRSTGCCLVGSMSVRDVRTLLPGRRDGGAHRRRLPSGSAVHGCERSVRCGRVGGQ